MLHHTNFKHVIGLLFIFATKIPFTMADFENIVKGGTASQPCTHHGAAANRAIDGNKHGNWGANSVTHTCECGGWWKAQLKEGSIVIVKKGYVWNCTDCCAEHLKDTKVEVLDAANNILCSKFITTMQTNHEIDFSSESCGNTAKYIRLSKNNCGILSMAEVEVIGTLITSSPTSRPISNHTSSHICSPSSYSIKLVSVELV